MQAYFYQPGRGESVWTLPDDTSLWQQPIDLLVPSGGLGQLPDDLLAQALRHVALIPYDPARNRLMGSARAGARIGCRFRWRLRGVSWWLRLHIESRTTEVRFCLRRLHPGRALSAKPGPAHICAGTLHILR